MAKINKEIFLCKWTEWIFSTFISICSHCSCINLDHPTGCIGLYDHGQLTLGEGSYSSTFGISQVWASPILIPMLLFCCLLHIQNSVLVPLRNMCFRLMLSAIRYTAICRDMCVCMCMHILSQWEELESHAALVFILSFKHNRKVEWFLLSKKLCVKLHNPESHPEQWFLLPISCIFTWTILLSLNATEPPSTFGFRSFSSNLRLIGNFYRQSIVLWMDKRLVGKTFYFILKQNYGALVRMNKKQIRNSKKRERNSLSLLSQNITIE